MNNGKICISVCAETSDELIEQMKRAAVLADVIEIRFDCLNRNEFNVFDLKVLQNTVSKIILSVRGKPLLQTFRPKEQGGNREISQKERDIFWNCGFDGGDMWADVEEDVAEDSWYWLWDKRICSYHDFNGVPENPNQIYERLKETNLDVVKIAFRAADITDTVPIWKLLQRAKSENKKIIPIAMGESGKWTRILGLAHGAFLTYASLEAGGETAPGQVSARDLIEVYRAKELDENTEVYGILGGDTSYSMSPLMHNAAFKFHGLNSIFVPLQVQNLDEFMKRMVEPRTREIELNFKGFSVTNPHKQNIIPHLDFIDETAQQIGAVNTVKIAGGKLYGYNTDTHGFIEPLLNTYGDLTGAKVAILGAGGAARACIYALKKHGAEVTIFARNVKKAGSLADEFQIELKELPKTEDQRSKTDFNTFDILVNSTPLGTKGEMEAETPAIADQFAGIKLAYDLVYNPFQTKFMQEAAKVHVPVIGGLAMLAAQAAGQQKIWTNLDAPIKEMSAAVLQRLK